MYNYVTGKAVGREPFSTKTDNKFFKCKLSCCKSCSYCARALPKERDKFRVSRLLSVRKQIKYVKGASCVTQLFCLKPVTNVKNVASNLPVGARLQNFWQTWLDLGAGPKVVQS